MKATSHETFLGLVAKAFYENYSHELCDICFVFPNRRSGVFFSQELLNISTRPVFSPEITTISDFLVEITKSIEITKIEALLVLYEEYCDILNKKGNIPEDFDRFASWGDIVLNDFNDIDKYLTDARSLFTNIKDHRDIKSNYLTKEQIETISFYFGEKSVSQYKDSDDTFWLNENNQSNTTRKFFSLWEILYELYVNFNKKLKTLKLSYSGRIYRDAVDCVKEMSVADFRHKQYVFVGFNVLSTSEVELFKLLGNKGIADYYWDYNSPALRDKANKASWFIQRNISMFRSKLDIHEKVINTFPVIKALAIPSNIGQAKYTSVLFDELIESGDISDLKNPVNTAIVLPDETLFVPLLDSINDKIRDVNITMGYPLNNTSIATLIGSISQMHKQAQYVDGQYCYMRDDVHQLLSHPFMQIAAQEESRNITEYVTKNRLFTIPADIIKELASDIYDIFSPVNEKKKPSELIIYIKNIIRFIEERLFQSDIATINSIENGFIARYIDLLNKLSLSITRHDNILMNDNTFFYLINRLLSSAKIAFEGEPLNGLQIMGILETRCLDFDNIIILSMNERVFPRKHFSRSFIPHNLRKGYGMATVEFQECMYAYYFYRMISRANNVYLLYDARTEAMGSGEASRFVHQLQTIYTDSNIVSESVNFDVQSPSELNITIPKTPRIMSLLEKYCSESSDEDEIRYLSASSINEYIDCPLAFYFDKIECLLVEDEVSEFIDSATLGTIVHSVLQKIYGEGKLITEDIIKKIKRDKDGLSLEVLKTINKEYLGKPNDIKSTSGETLLIRNALLRLIEGVLNYDMNIDFIVIQSEKKECFHWKLTDELAINIKQYIDRVDSIIDKDNNRITRIIDYKTGKDIVNSSVENMFVKPKSSDRAKAMLQLMIYCNVYSHIHDVANIEPMIYLIRNINESGFKVDGNKIENYKDINKDFMSNFTNVISDIFNPDIPFTPAKDDSKCKYCKFATLCRR